MESPRISRINSDELMDAALALKCCSEWINPPQKKQNPSTSSSLERMEPSSDTWVTRSMPFWMASTEMMSSVALPRVALSRPPITSPTRSATSSVQFPSIWASGRMARKLKVKAKVSPHLSTPATGPSTQKTSRRLSLGEKSATRLARSVGSPAEGEREGEGGSMGEPSCAPKWEKSPPECVLLRLWAALMPAPPSFLPFFKLRTCLVSTSPTVSANVLGCGFSFGVVIDLFSTETKRWTRSSFNERREKSFGRGSDSPLYILCKLLSSSSPAYNSFVPLRAICSTPPANI
mmetsp:Transcript_25632/g.48569  ORF Transcript_25632/g.48569 Transcript_25632/m.48569 type:complete len:291 (+) Transcript_25632:1044-1916(+)